MTNSSNNQVVLVTGAATGIGNLTARALGEAGHLYVGYAEAFTPVDIQHLFDINVIGIQRVNRAVLPRIRERRLGTLLYVGCTI